MPADDCDSKAVLALNELIFEKRSLSSRCAELEAEIHRLKKRNCSGGTNEEDVISRLSGERKGKEQIENEQLRMEVRLLREQVRGSAHEIRHLRQENKRLSEKLNSCEDGMACNSVSAEAVSEVRELKQQNEEYATKIVTLFDLCEETDSEFAVMRNVHEEKIRQLYSLCEEKDNEIAALKWKVIETESSWNTAGHIVKVPLTPTPEIQIEPVVRF